MVSHIKEEDVIKFERNISKLVNIQFPGAGQVKISGYRINKKYVTARLVGAPRWVEKSDIDLLFSWWGRVITSERGSSSLSLPTGNGGKFGTGWVWNKECPGL